METSHTQLVSHRGEYSSLCPLLKDQRKVHTVHKCYDPGSDFSARLLTGYDYGTLQVSSHISHGQSPQSAE